MLAQTRTTSIRCAGWVLVTAHAFVMLGIMEPATMASPQTGPTSSPPAADDQPNEENEAPNREDKRKRRAVRVAIYLLWAVVFGVFAVLVLMAIWGHHLRRIARKPLPRQTQTDEFWYLRPDKTLEVGDSPELSESDPDAESGTG